MISRPQIFRNRKLLVVHKRFSWRGKVIHRRLRRSTRLPRRRINNFEMGIRRERKRGGWDALLSVLDSENRDDRMCSCHFVFDPVAFVKAQATPAVALAGEDIQVTVAVPIHYVST